MSSQLEVFKALHSDQQCISPKGPELKLTANKLENKQNYTTIRCLKRTLNAIHILLHLILILILVVQIAECIGKYLKVPTYIETKPTLQHKAIFPAMTVCPHTNGYKEDVLQVNISIILLSF